MKLTVLGKYGPYAAPGGATSGYLLEESDTRMVLDMGAGTLSRLQEKIDLRTLTAIYLTHLHFDHTSDMLTLIYALEAMQHQLKVFAPLDDSPWCRVLFEGRKEFAVTDISDGLPFTVGHFRCGLLKTAHPVPNYAVRVSCGGKLFVYTGDSGATDTLIPFAEGADLVLGDFSKPIGFEGAHMTVADAVALQKRTGVKLLATHISPGDTPAAFFKNHPNIAVAQEGETYII